MEISRIHPLPGHLLVRLAGQPGPAAEPVEVVPSGKLLILKPDAKLTLVHMIDTPSLVRYFLVSETEVLADVDPIPVKTKKNK